MKRFCICVLAIALLVPSLAQAQESRDKSPSAPIDKAKPAKPTAKKVSIRRAKAAPAPSPTRPPATAKPPAKKAAKKVKKKSPTTSPETVPDTEPPTVVADVDHWCAGVPDSAFNNVFGGTVISYDNSDPKWTCGFSNGAETLFAMISSKSSLQYSWWKIGPGEKELVLGKDGVGYTTADGTYKIEIMLDGGRSLIVFGGNEQQAINIANTFIARYPPLTANEKRDLSSGSCPTISGEITGKSLSGVFNAPMIRWDFVRDDGTKICQLIAESNDVSINVYNDNVLFSELQARLIKNQGFKLLGDPNLDPYAAAYVDMAKGYYLVLIGHPIFGLIRVEVEFIAPGQRGMILNRTFEGQSARAVQIARDLLAMTTLPQ
jgi:hypothetical protein